MTFEHADGSLRSVPLNWTNVVPADAYLSLGGGQSRFRVEDLLRLADVVTSLATRSR